MNPGTAGGGGETLVGAGCTFLAGSHVAHDCRVGDGVILSNNVMLAGHCRVGDHAILGGGAAAHQFVRIGAHAFVGGLTGLTEDLIPFGVAVGDRARLAGVNVVGMKRRGFTVEDVHGPAARLQGVVLRGRHASGAHRRRSRSSPGCAPVQSIVAFLREGGDRAGVTSPARGRGRVSAPLALVCGSGTLPVEAAREAQRLRPRAVSDRPRRLGGQARSRRSRICGCGSARSASCCRRCARAASRRWRFWAR